MMKLKIAASAHFNNKKGCHYDNGVFHLTNLNGVQEAISADQLLATCVMKANSIRGQASFMAIIGCGMIIMGLALPGLCFLLAPLFAKFKYANLLTLHFDDGRYVTVQAKPHVRNMLTNMAKDPNRYEHIF